MKLDKYKTGESVDTVRYSEYKILLCNLISKTQRINYEEYCDASRHNSED